MHKIPTRTPKGLFFARFKKALCVLAVLATLAVVVVACPRRSFHYGTTIYGGRQFDTFVSCGGSSGNYAYTCAEGGGCYENTSIDADAACDCGPVMERPPV